MSKKKNSVEKKLELKKGVSCGICRMVIDRNTDDYFNIRGFRGKIQSGNLFYHKVCYMNFIQQKDNLESVKSKAMSILDTVKQRVTA